MGFFKLGTMTLGGFFKKKDTLKYPFETKEAYEGQKGTVKHNDKALCNLCGICSKKCPSGAITVNRKEKTWAINHLGCVQCKYCVLSCPKKCLIMDVSMPNVEQEIIDEIVNIPLPDKKPKVVKEDPEKTKESKAVNDKQ